MLTSVVLLLILEIPAIVSPLADQRARSKRIKLRVLSEIALVSLLYVITKRVDSDFYLFYFLPCLSTVEYLSVSQSAIIILVVVFSLLIAVEVAGIFDPSVNIQQDMFEIILRTWLPRATALILVYGIILFWRRINQARRLVWSAFLAAVPEGLTIIDKRDMRIRWANDKIQSGFFKDRKLINEKCYLGYKREGKPCEPCPILHALKGEIWEEITYSPEYILKNKDGTETVPPKNEWRRYDTFCAPILVRDDIVAAIECVKDSTAREVLHETTRQLQAAKTEEEILDILLDGLRALGYRRCRIYVLSEDGTKLVGRASRGMEEMAFEGLELPIANDRYSKQTFEGFEPQVYQPTNEEPHGEILKKDPTLTWIEIPLRIEDRILGKISCDNKGHPMKHREMMVEEVQAFRSGRRSDYLNVLHNLGVQGSFALRHLRVERDLAAMLWMYVHTYIGFENIFISNASALLNESGAYTKAELQEIYEDFVGVIRTIARLGDNVLDWSEYQSEAGLKLDISSEAIDVIAVIKDVIRWCRFMAKAYRCKIELICEEAVYGHVDKARLQQIVFGLLDNSLKAIDSSKDSSFEGYIYVKVSEVTAEDIIQIEIEDNGPGIPPEYADVIFEPWVRRPFRGHGIGLYLAQRIAEMHGGSLELDKEYSDGARFILRLRNGGTERGEIDVATTS